MVVRWLAVLGFLVVVFATPVSVAAQEPEPTQTPTPTSTPTVTPTPGYLREEKLSQGESLIIERRITYGEIAVVVAVAVLVVILTVNMLLYWSRQWVR